MPKRPQEFLPGEFYHIYNRGANRQKIFFERGNYVFFLQRYREKITTDHVTTLAYCLMPNHFHFLIRLESSDFSSRMQALGTSYSKALNRQRDRSGALFQGRFQAKQVEEESYLIHLSRYLHLNPVEAKLVTQPSDWEYSSYRDYVGLRKGTLPNTELLLREFDSREHYRNFVEETSQKMDKIMESLVIDE